MGVPTEYQTTLQMSTNMPKTIRLAVLKLVGAPLTGSGQVGAGQTVFGALEADGMRKSAYR